MHYSKEQKEKEKALAGLCADFSLVLHYSKALAELCTDFSLVL